MNTSLAPRSTARGPKRAPSAAPSTIGQRIAHRRRESGLTQQQLARLAHVHRQVISDIERDCTEMKICTLADICKALRVSADWVLGISAPSQHRETTVLPERMRA